MSRITEESIRIKAMEVQREMALLKAFTNRHGEHTNLCIVHDWHLGETEAPVAEEPAATPEPAAEDETAVDEGEAAEEGAATSQETQADESAPADDTARQDTGIIVAIGIIGVGVLAAAGIWLYRMRQT